MVMVEEERNELQPRQSPIPQQDETLVKLNFDTRPLVGQKLTQEEVEFLQHEAI